MSKLNDHIAAAIIAINATATTQGTDPGSRHQALLQIALHAQHRALTCLPWRCWDMPEMQPRLEWMADDLWRQLGEMHELAGRGNYPQEVQDKILEIHNLAHELADLLDI